MAGDPFSSKDHLVVSDCPKSGSYSTPLQRFSIKSALSLSNTSDNSPYYLQTPYSLADGSEQGDKCVCTNDNDESSKGGSSVSLEKCPENTAEKWEWVLKLISASRNTEGHYVLIQHKMSQACLKIAGNKVVTDMTCEVDKAEFNWEMIQ